MIALGAAVGFIAGLLNPFNVGVAQDIAELQLFSGMAYRVFILVVLLDATSAYIICYARKVAAHPEKSVIYGIPEDQEYTFDNATDTITVRQIAREFGEGAKGIIVGCLIIGIARTVEIILSDANILDTHHYAKGLVQQISAICYMKFQAHV